MQNYFELFDLKTSFFIDEAVLKRSYQSEISRFHPDNFVTKSEPEKLQALQNTSLLNSAYSALKTPLSRATYLLKLEGMDAFDEKDTAMEKGFLLSQIELRDELEAIEENKNNLGLDNFIERVDSFIEEKIELISEAYNLSSDQQLIKRHVRELKFFDQLYKEANALMDEWF
jgi:molecular chaperone HscB